MHRFIRCVTSRLHAPTRQFVSGMKPESKQLFNLSQLDNDSFLADLRANLLARQSQVDLSHILDMWKRYSAGDHSIESQLMSMVKQLPNSTHPLTPVGDPSKARQIYLHGHKRDVKWKLKDAVSLGTNPPDKKPPLEVSKFYPSPHLRLRNVASGVGPRTYYFGGPLAQLESALIDYTLDRLSQAGFALVSVPDVLPEPLIHACGFPTRGERSQVYKLCSDDGTIHCLSGTAEMGLAGFCAGRRFDLGGETGEATTSTAVGLCAVSRCFRQEAPHHEDLLYRVHQFTKVEMFGLTAPDRVASDVMFDKILRLQMTMFADLGLHFRVLEMPTSELGDSAHRKIDIEAWMPGEGIYGEISSTSNCLDYQSKRLNMRWADDQQYAYTLNGTACAVPRMMKAILETHQNKDGSISVPEVLLPILSKKGSTQSPVEMRLKYIVSES